MQAIESAGGDHDALARTALYDLHVEHGARFVAFAGHAMPLNFRGGILAEHRHTRSHASLFDVSHMGRFRISGAGATRALESICPADLFGLPSGRLCYTLLTSDEGGIIDDVTVRRAGGDFELIGNAARRAVDCAWLEERIGERCAVQPEEFFTLLALQGPEAAAVLRELNPAVDALSFMQTAPMQLAGYDCQVTRSGYTGEDGFEISVPVDAAVALARRLLAHAAVEPAGLGARDGLRLEAGLCLYGQDIDLSTSPVEAGLAWTIARARRPGGARAGGFPGSRRIFAELALGPPRRRTGVLPAGKAPVRAGTPLTDAGDREIGRVTSGGYSPILDRPIALAYIESHDLDREIECFARVRGRRVAVKPCPLPFVAHRYRRAPA